jgi:hypothetical protein
MLEGFIDPSRQVRLETDCRVPADGCEQVGIAEPVLAGGYGDRQIVELVSNGADAISQEEASSMAQGALSEMPNGLRAADGQPRGEEACEVLLATGRAEAVADHADGHTEGGDEGGGALADGLKLRALPGRPGRSDGVGAAHSRARA